MEKGRISKGTVMRKRKVKPEAQPQSEQDKALKKRVKELETRLLQAEIKAEAYDEMIKIAEARYRIPIRKKLAPNSEGPVRKGLRAIQRPGPVRAVWQEQAGILPVRREPGPGQGRTGGVRPRVHQGHQGQGPRHRRREAVAHVPEGVQLRRPDRPRPLLPDHRREPPQGAPAAAMWRCSAERDMHQHDRVRRPEGERAGRAHQQHDEERAAQGQGLPFPGRGHRGHGSGGRLLQQPPTAHEHRHDDSGRGFRDIRGQGYEMEELQDDGNKKQE